MNQPLAPAITIRIPGVRCAIFDFLFCPVWKNTGFAVAIHGGQAGVDSSDGVFASSSIVSIRAGGILLPRTLGKQSSVEKVVRQ